MASYISFHTALNACDEQCITLYKDETDIVVKKEMEALILHYVNTLVDEKTHLVILERQRICRTCMDNE